MSTEEHDTHQQQPEPETREVTVSVPAHRVDQFLRFHERFLAMAEHWDARVGREDLRGRRGRHGHGPHGHGHGHGHGHRRCRSRRDEAAA